MNLLVRMEKQSEVQINSPHREKNALLQKRGTQKWFCIIGHMRWNVSFDLIPHLRKMSVKYQGSGRLIDSESHQKSCSFEIPYTSPLVLPMSPWIFQHTDGLNLSSRTESIPPSAYCFGINPKLTGGFSDAFLRIQQPPPPICWGTRPMSSKGKVT